MRKEAFEAFSVENYNETKAHGYLMSALNELHCLTVLGIFPQKELKEFFSVKFLEQLDELLISKGTLTTSLTVEC